MPPILPSPYSVQGDFAKLQVGPTIRVNSNKYTLRTFQDTKIEERGDTFHLQFSIWDEAEELVKKSTPVARKIVEDLFTSGFHTGDLVVRYRANRLILLPYSNFIGGNAKLTCLDADTGALKWQSIVWGAPLLPGSGIGGMARHAMHVDVEDDHIAVFGGGSLGFYAEAFDMKDGHPRFRFCTDYWGHDGLVLAPGDAFEEVE